MCETEIRFRAFDESEGKDLFLSLVSPSSCFSGARRARHACSFGLVVESFGMQLPVAPCGTCAHLSPASSLSSSSSSRSLPIPLAFSPILDVSLKCAFHFYT